MAQFITSMRYKPKFV